jgi:hypothetical protein
MTTITGDRELTLLFERFPASMHERLKNRVTELVAEMEARARAAAPRGVTGKLQSEIVGRVYADKPTRVAGYVSVYAPGDPKEYPKAATLEYGSDKPRRTFERLESSVADRHGRAHRRIIARTEQPIHIRAYKYLHGALEGMESDIESELAAAVKEEGGSP